MAGQDEPMRIPGRVKPGNELSAGETNLEREALAKLDRGLRSRTVRGSADVGMRRNGGGTTLFLKKKPGTKRGVPGFRPVERGLGSDGLQTRGVGLVAGRVIVLHIVTTGDDDDPKVGQALMPTLNGTALDADPAPREELAAGDWEAWVRASPTAASVEFLQSGPPSSLADNERAVRVAKFSVELPEDEQAPQIPKVLLIEQEVEDQLFLWVDNREEESGGFSHPWKVTSNGDDTVNVAAGNVGWWEEQNSDPWVAPMIHTYEKFSATAEVEVTAAGYIVAVYNANHRKGGETAFTNGGNLNVEALGEYAGSKDVRFSETPTDETADIVLVLAEVSLAAGVAVVDYQVLTHNPIVAIPRLSVSA